MAFLFVESSSHSNVSVLQSVVKALKLLFFSAGLISTLLMVKGALVPFVYEIFFPNLIAIWSSFRYFLSSPLYICIIINSVVLLIAATSTFHDHDPPPPRWVEAPPPQPETAALLSSTSSDEQCSTASTLYNQGSDIDDCTTQITLCQGSDVNDDINKALDSLSRDEREGEGDDDTIDSTWKTIIEGKTKKLTKSESVPPRSGIEDQHSSTPSAAATWKELRKLETFNDGASRRRLGGLRRDPSVGVEEFNQQVEAFIKKFNQDMRLQRQESDQRFLDMIKRGL